MLIVLGGLAAIPIEPYESAEIDGANAFQKFRYITLPMIAPFLMVAVIIRTIDALKSFDIIYAITQGGPGTASETINIYLYSVAFAYYDVGYGSAIAVVFFALVVALSLVMLHLRQRTKWMELRSGGMRGGLPRPAHRLLPRRPRPRLAGGAVLPLDAVALAQIRDRQRRLSADPHPGALRLEELRRRVRIEPFRPVLPQQPDRHRHRRRCSRSSSACRPATASPA